MGKTVAQGAGLGIAARVQEDGPETWETSYLHLENRCDGGPVITLRLVAGYGRTCDGVKKKRPPGGRPIARDDRSGGRWGRGVGGLRSSDEVGEPEGTGTRRSEGGPC